MASIAGITIEIGGDTTALTKALTGVNKQSRDLQSELRQVDRLLKLDPKNTELLAQKQKMLGESVENTKKKLDILRDAERQAQEQFKKGDIAEEQYRAIQREVIKAEQDLKKLEKQLMNTNNGWKDAAENLNKFGKKATDVGKEMSMKVTAPIVGAAAASMVAWNEVDGALDTIVTKTGATGEAMEGLEQSFRKVASTMPVEMQAVGDAIGEVNTQFGLTGEKLENATAQMLKFAEINGQDVTSATINSKEAIEAFGLSADNLNEVLDAVTKTAQNTGVSTDKIFDSVVRGAPQLKSMGLDFAQASEIMGRFEQKGIDSSKSLSYLAKAQVEFAKDGKTMSEGLTELINKIQNSKSETDALNLASETFGTKGATFMLDAIKRGALDFKDFANAATEASGSVAATFEGTQDPVDKFTVAMNNLKLVGSDIGSTLQESLAPVLEKIVEKLQGFAEWFKKLSPEMKNTIILVGGIVAAIGPLLVIIGQMSTGIGAIIGVVGKLIPLITGATGATGGLGAAMTIITGPIGIAVAAIAAITAAVVYLWNTNEDFRNAVIQIWEKIKSFLVDAGNKIKDGFLAVMNFLKNNWKEVLLFITNPIAGAVALLYKLNPQFKAWVDNLISNVKQWFIGMVQAGKDLVTGLWNGISENWTWLTTKIKEWCGNIASTIKSFFGIHSPSTLMAMYGKNIAEGLEKGIKENEGKPEGAMVNMAEVIGNAFNRVKDTTTAAVNMINKELELWGLQNRELEGTVEALNMKLQAQEKQLPILAENVRLAEQALNDIIYEFGEGSKEAQEYTQKLLDEKIAYEKLKNEIYSTADALKLETAALAERNRVQKQRATSYQRDLQSAFRSTYEEAKILKQFGYSGQEIMDYATEQSKRIVDPHYKDYPEITQNITITSPEPLTPSETGRQIKNATRALAMEW